MVSRSAMVELCKEGLDLHDVLDILENGTESPRRRARGTIERRLERRGRVHEVVIVEDHHHVLNEDVWLLIHVGTFTKR